MTRLPNTRLKLAARRRSVVDRSQVIEFLRQLLRQIRGPIVLLWDSNRPHGAADVRTFLARHPRGQTVRLPGYAPELKPDQCVRIHIKRAVVKGVLQDLSHLKRLLHRPLQRLPQSQKLMWSCIRTSGLRLGGQVGRRSASCQFRTGRIG